MGEQEYIKSMSRASLSFRFRMAVGQRLKVREISENEKAIILKELIDNKNKLETERDSLIKLIMYSLMALLFLTAGQDFEIPVLKVQISEIPSILQIVLVTSALSYFLLGLKFVDIQAYSSVISSYLRSNSAESHQYDLLGDHIDMMRFEHTSSWYQILSKDHSIRMKENFRLKLPARVFSGLIIFSILLIVSMIVFLPLIYLNYIAWELFGAGLVNNLLSGFVFSSSFFTVLIICIELIPFQHDYWDENLEKSK